jgi:hypothetical protein
MAGTIKSVIWFGGEVTDGAAIEPGLYTTALENLYIDEQKQPNIRLSTELIASYPVKNLGPLKGAFSGEEHTIHAYRPDATTIVLLIYNFKSKLFVRQTITSTVIKDSIKFFEIASSDLSSGLNPHKDVEVVVMVSGADKLYYVEGVNLRKFQILTYDSSAPTYQGRDVIEPIDCTIIQSRFVIMCAGPPLAESAVSFNQHRVLLSQIDQLENFNVNATGPYLARNAIDAILLCSSGEKFLAITSLTNVIVITSTIGLRIISSGLTNDSIITSGNIINYITSFGDCIASRAFAFSSFLVFATERTLRAKNLQLAESNERESVDMELPLLTSMDDNIVDISFNSSTQTIDCFLVNGLIRSLFFQSVIPSGSYPLSLPTTTSHKHPAISWHTARGKLTTATVNDRLCIFKENKDYGILAEGVSAITWPLRLNNLTKQTFTASFINIIATDDIVALWLKTSDKWCLCLRDNNTSLDFNTTADVNLTTLTGEQHCILNVRDKAYEILPEPYKNSQYAVGQIEAAGRVIFFNNPIRSFGFFPDDSDMLDDIKCFLAVGGLESKIGWRDVEGLKGPQKSHECTLVSRYNDLDEYAEFYNNASTAQYQRYKDYGAINFITPKDIGYCQIEISASLKTIKPTNKRHKYLRLLTD